MDQTNTTMNEWEELLKDVTFERDWREVPWDSSIISEIGDRIEVNELLNERLDEYPNEEMWRAVDTLRKIADKKLEGRDRTIFLLYLLSGKTQEEIANTLNVHPDTVRRSIERSVRVIRELIQTKKYGDFPVGPGKRPYARVRVFALDSREEKERFLHFVNEHEVWHLAFTSNDLFREAMVIYLTNPEQKCIKGKPKGA